ncbi:hypothetical protein [Ruminococcus sp.]
MVIDKISKKLICTIRLENNDWNLYDCDGEKLPVPSNKRIFSSSMKKHYLKKRERENQKNDISTVWILVGILDNGKKVCEQVGRTKDIINSLTEIKDNVKDFYRSDGKKYGALKDKNYKEIVFYEVDIDEYIKNDKLFKKLYGNVPNDEYLSLAYYFIRAAYVEGKLGFETSASMYHKSSLDEYFFDYYKRNKLSEII